MRYISKKNVYFKAYENEIENLTETMDRFERQAERVYYIREQKLKASREGKSTTKNASY